MSDPTKIPAEYLKFVVEILNTGVTGFAVILLYLSYKLLVNVQSKITEVNPSDCVDFNIYHEWIRAIHDQLINARLFMLVTALIFAGSLFGLFYRSESNIVLHAVPISQNEKFKITHLDKTISLDEDGKRCIPVKSDETIIINNEGFVKEFSEMHSRIDVLERERLSSIILSTSKSIGEAGAPLN